MTTEQTMIERVARAMQADAGQPADEAYWETACTGAAVWRSLARAAIQSMTEPTDAMIDRFVSRALCVSIHGDGGWSNYAREQWQAMIQAALHA